MTSAIRTSVMLVALVALVGTATAKPLSLDGAQRQYRAVLKSSPALQKVHRRQMWKQGGKSTALLVASGATTAVSLASGIELAAAPAGFITLGALAYAAETPERVRLATTRAAVEHKIIHPATAEAWHKAGFIGTLEK